LKGLKSTKIRRHFVVHFFSKRSFLNESHYWSCCCLQKWVSDFTSFRVPRLLDDDDDEGAKCADGASACGGCGRHKKVHRVNAVQREITFC
jgi:hypothetical protein